MTALDLLREISSENNGLILTKIAVEKGISRATLSQLCKEGKLCRVVMGQYSFPNDFNDAFWSLSLRSDLLVFSHESALFLNGMLKKAPLEQTVTIPSSKTMARSISDQCKIYYIKEELHDLGKVQLKTPFGNNVWAYDLDRTVCDIIRSRSRISDDIFISAIKNYAKSSDKNLANLDIYAKQMNILSKVKQCLELLL